MADEKQERRHEVTIRAEIPKSANLTPEQVNALVEQTTNEIVDEFTGERAVAFIKAKAEEKAEIAVSKEETKQKVIF